MKTVDIDAKALYRTMHCSHKGYMTKNHGMLTLPDWIGLIKNRDGSPLHHWDHASECKDHAPSILEIGCGNGALCEYLSLLADVTGIDITDSPVRQEGKKDYGFHEIDVTSDYFDQINQVWDYVISFDVLEHLQREAIGPTICTIGTKVEEVLIKVACSGNPPLHMTIESPGWWLDMFMKHAPDHNWSIIRNYRRQDEKGNDIFAPLFYGRKD